MSKIDDNVNYADAGTPDDIIEAIHALRHLFVARQYKASSGGDLDLSHGSGKALSFFSRNPGATQRDFAAHSSRDKGQIARLISALKERGLLEARADEADRRVLRLHVTERGREARVENDRRRARLAKAAVVGLDANERRNLIALLSRIRQNLDDA